MTVRSLRRHLPVMQLLPPLSPTVAPRCHHSTMHALVIHLHAPHSSVSIHGIKANGVLRQELFGTRIHQGTCQRAEGKIIRHISPVTIRQKYPAVPEWHGPFHFETNGDTNFEVGTVVLGAYSGTAAVNPARLRERRSANGESFPQTGSCRKLLDKGYRAQDIGGCKRPGPARGPAGVYHAAVPLPGKAPAGKETGQTHSPRRRPVTAGAPMDAANSFGTGPAV